jgi:aminoglycoside 6-adenylyltransferase
VELPMGAFTFAVIRDRVKEIAVSREDIISVAVFGSQARDARPADEWSDLDLLMFVTDPEVFLRESDWLESIGDPLIDFHESGLFGFGVERRVLFQEYLDVDFLLFPENELRRIFDIRDVAHWLESGLYVLIDKDGRLSGILRAVSERAPEPERPRPAIDYRNMIGDFYFHVVWAAKKLMRGEILVAKNCCDNYMKGILLRLLAANVAAKGGAQEVPADKARYFEQWAGDETAAAFSCSASGHTVLPEMRSQTMKQA